MLCARGHRGLIVPRCIQRSRHVTLTDASQAAWKPRVNCGTVSNGVVPQEQENHRVAHILVVEDEKQLAELVRDHLVAAGHSVVVAGDGANALRLLETRPADLVILDWMLPGLDGLEVCRRIRARSITPILMLPPPP